MPNSSVHLMAKEENELWRNLGIHSSVTRIPTILFSAMGLFQDTGELLKLFAFIYGQNNKW